VTSGLARDGAESRRQDAAGARGGTSYQRASKEGRLGDVAPVPTSRPVLDAVDGADLLMHNSNMANRGGVFDTTISERRRCHTTVA
jgi:hypothetical protein